MKKLVFMFVAVAMMMGACSGEREYLNYRGMSMGMSAKQMVDSLQMQGLALDTNKYEDRYVFLCRHLRHNFLNRTNAKNTITLNIR